MSSSGSKNGGGGGGLSPIPVAWRKTVQGVKEIVNCPEHEIYAMLKECNMDPNDTVHRLLSQDTFHEVKSKRERRKEMKDTQDSRSRGISSGLNCSVKGGGSDRNLGRSGQTQIGTSELDKPVYKRENGSVAPMLFSSFTPQTAGQTTNQLPQSYSNSVIAANKGQSIGTVDAISSSAKPSPRFQSSWSGGSGHVSMADIVRMGRLQSKASSTETSYLPHDAVGPNSSYDHLKHPHISAPLLVDSHRDSHSQNPVSDVSEMINETSNTAGQHVFREEWPVIDQPTAASGSSATSDVETYSFQSNLHSSGANLSLNCQPDEVQVSDGDVAFKNINAEHNGLASASSRLIIVDGAGGASHFGNDSLEYTSSYYSHGHTFEHQEGVGGGSQSSFPNHSAPLTDDFIHAVSSAAADFEKLGLGNEDVTGPPTEENCAVVIPNHLQVSAADCSHLSFGTFKSNIVSGFSGSLASNPSEEVSAAAINGSSLAHAHLDAGIPEYNGDEQYKSMSDAHRVAANARNYDSPISSQPELMKQAIFEANHIHQDTFPSSVPGYDIESRLQPGSASSYAQSNPHIRDLPTFPPSAMHAYSNSPASNLLASSVQSLRESDLPYTPFLAAQSTPSRYSSAVSSINSPTISMSEVLNPGTFSVPQPTSLSLPGTSIATGPPLPQSLTVHPYSQPTLPLGHAANMMGYPYVPQSYAYLPSAFQQAYPGSTAFHQSLAALEGAGLKYTVPQYRNSASVSSLPQSAGNASGYGSFGGSTNIPGSFLQNPSAGPTGSTIGYDEFLISQYKDGNHFVPLQQNENSATSVYGPGSRTLPSTPASSYYGLQGPSQQHAGYGHGQQSSQLYGGIGYSDYLQSQTGNPQEHQQQSPGDSTINGVQAPSSKQLHQMWQPSYY